MTMAEGRYKNYWSWLDRFIFIRFKDRDHNSIYSTIIRSLKRPFFVSLEHDRNRVSDGLELREEYQSLYGAPAPSSECTILEVLIALSRRMAFITSETDLEEGEAVKLWFWDMVENLGISEDPLENDRILTFWLDRKFKKNGLGSPFPIKNVTKNQRTVELWYQMQSYLSENFIFS